MCTCIVATKLVHLYIYKDADHATAVHTVTVVHIVVNPSTGPTEPTRPSFRKENQALRSFSSATALSIYIHLHTETNSWDKIVNSIAEGLLKVEVQF